MARSPAGPAATLDYTPAGGYTGTDSFTFVARDDRGVASPVVTEHLQVVATLAPTCTAGSPITLRPGQAKAVGFNCSRSGLPAGHLQDRRGAERGR